MSIKKKLPKISIIVLNYNGKKYLKNCFESLKKTDYPNFEVIMVDNNSDDGSIEYVRKKFPWVRILKSPENKGWAYGNNFGIKNTKGEYVVLLNNDVIVTKDWLKELVKIAQSDPKIGIVGSWPVWYKCMGQDLSKFPYSGKIIEASTVSGAAMLVKREVFDKIGLFEEKYFIYWEDTEFTWRAILAGYKVISNYNSIIYHIGGGYTKKNENIRWVYEKVKNRIHCHIKLMNISYLIHFMVFELLKFFLHFILIPSEFIRGNSIKFKAYLKAWIWNIKNIRETYKERMLFKKMMKKRHRKLIELIIYDEYRKKRDYHYLKKC